MAIIINKKKPDLKKKNIGCGFVRKGFERRMSKMSTANCRLYTQTLHVVNIHIKRAFLQFRFKMKNSLSLSWFCVNRIERKSPGILSMYVHFGHQ